MADKPTRPMIERIRAILSYQITPPLWQRPAPAARPEANRKKGLLNRLLSTSGCLWKVAAVLLVVMLIVFYPPLVPAVLSAAGVLALVGAVVMLFRFRRQRARVILAYLEQAVRLNLPLPRMLHAAMSGESGVTAWRISQLTELLGKGMSLGEALQIAVPEMPRRTVHLIAAGERVGTLRRILHELVVQERKRTEGRIDSTFFYRWYALSMMLFLPAGLVFLMVWVIPSYAKIFADYHSDLPAPTTYLIRFSDWIANEYGWVLIIPPLCLVFLAIFAKFLPQNFLARVLISRLRPLADAFRWWFPPTRSLEESRGLADICQLLGEAVEGGMNVPAALRETLNLDLNLQLTRKIELWAQGLDRGLDVAAAADQARMPRLMVGLLKTGQASTNLDEVLLFLARYYRTRFSRTLAFIQGAAGPIIVLFMGAIVGYVVVSFFLPLVQLINAAASFEGGVL